jgi:hypothetical protein
MQSCPFCEELIQDGALKCRYCREWLVEPPADRVLPPDVNKVADGEGSLTLKHDENISSTSQSERPNLESHGHKSHFPHPKKFKISYLF